MAPFIAPIEVPEIMSNLIFFFSNALLAPHAKAPRDPPPCNTRTFSTVWLDVDVDLDVDVFSTPI